MDKSDSDCILKGLRRATPDIWRTPVYGSSPPAPVAPGRIDRTASGPRPAPASTYVPLAQFAGNTEAAMTTGTRTRLFSPTTNTCWNGWQGPSGQTPLWRTARTAGAGL